MALSENYACIYSSESQSEHFASNQQQALHTGVLHVRGMKENVCLGTISSFKEKAVQPHGPIYPQY